MNLCSTLYNIQYDDKKHDNMVWTTWTKQVHTQKKIQFNKCIFEKKYKFNKNKLSLLVVRAILLVSCNTEKVSNRIFILCFLGIKKLCSLRLTHLRICLDTSRLE